MQQENRLGRINSVDQELLGVPVWMTLELTSRFVQNQFQPYSMSSGNWFGKLDSNTFLARVEVGWENLSDRDSSARHEESQELITFMAKRRAHRMAFDCISFSLISPLMSATRLTLVHVFSKLCNSVSSPLRRNRNTRSYDVWVWDLQSSLMQFEQEWKLINIVHVIVLDCSSSPILSV